MNIRTITLLVSLLLFSPMATARIGTVDGIAFVVNNGVITLSEWERELGLAKQEMNYLPPGQRLTGDELEDYVARVMITSKFQDIFAKQSGIYVQDREVDNAIQDIAARNGTDVETLREYIVYQGMDFNQYRESIRGQMLAARLQNEIVQSLNFTENEIDLFMKTADFKKIKDQLAKANAPQNKARHILIAVNKDKSEERALQEANRLRDRILAGEISFEDVARANSQDPVSAADEGSLGWVGQGQLMPEFEKVMVTLPIGEISKPVRTPYGYHLIRVDERRTGFQDNEAMRNVAKEFYFRKKAAAKYDEWLDRMLSDIYVEKRVGTQK